MPRLNRVWRVRLLYLVYKAEDASPSVAASLTAQAEVMMRRRASREVVVEDDLRSRPDTPPPASTGDTPALSIKQAKRARNKKRSKRTKKKGSMPREKGTETHTSTGPATREASAAPSAKKKRRRRRSPKSGETPAETPIETPAETPAPGSEWEGSPNVDVESDYEHKPSAPKRQRTALPTPKATPRKKSAPAPPKQKKLLPKRTTPQKAILVPATVDIPPGTRSSTFAKVLRLVLGLAPPARTEETKKGPPPAGQPPVWAESRQELCETLPYYRAYQAGMYMCKRVAYGYLLDSYPAPRDVWAAGGRVIISHG